MGHPDLIAPDYMEQYAGLCPILVTFALTYVYSRDDHIRLSESVENFLRIYVLKHNISIACQFSLFTKIIIFIS